MCGIVGYVGKDQALPILISGLKVLEYRGYDSAGIALVSTNEAAVKKSVGPVSNLEEKINNSDLIKARLGIGHTRWATHGLPNEINCHPHSDCSQNIFLVHNGIIENYKELKKYLTTQGHIFKSETDTEVIAHLIEYFEHQGKKFKAAFLDTLKMIKGAYALAVIDKRQPEVLYAAKLSSPLVIGVGEKENYVASDPAALIGKTKKIIYLKDNEVAQITSDKIFISNFDDIETISEISNLEGSLETAQKGHYPHFMLKEIFEGPEVVIASLRGRLKSQEKIIKLGGLEEIADILKNLKRIIILGCGTSYFAGLVGEYILEKITKIPTEVHFASEFRYRDQPFEPGTVVIAISQSGETADTLAALQKAKKHNLPTIGIVNTVGSTIAREADAGVYNHAGPEIGVASTKAFISQVTILILLALYLLEPEKTDTFNNLLDELERIPNKIQSILDRASEIEVIASKYQKFEHFLFLGRTYNYPVALEGALKLKEISYIHAEGYGAGEMKHGPIAMISQAFPTLALVPKNNISDKIFSNLEEIKARSGPIIAIATFGDTAIKEVADDIFYIPETLEVFEPLLTVVPLHLFAYYVGTQRGFDVDKPRNLAKSVTVE